jgi:hypothetical protein
MRKALAGALVLALAALAGPVSAQDAPPVERPATEARIANFLGANGLLLAPSAYAQGDRTVQPFFYGQENFIGGGAIGGFGDRFEVGLGIIDFDGGDTEFAFNAKYQFLTETDSRPAIAAGVIDLFDQFDVDPSWYVVASKYFTRSEIEQRFALKGHVGFGGGVYDEEIFAGGEFFFNQNLSAVAEFVNSDFNVGVRYTYRGWAFSLALFDVEDFGGGLTYTTRF